MSMNIYRKILKFLKDPIPHVNAQNIVPVVLVHGGAGDVTKQTIDAKKQGVKLAARIGYETLRNTGNVVDAVQYAVQTMEKNDNFNAGCGAALTLAGEVEMDAAIMNGFDLYAGCVSVVKDILHPISLARCVMEKTRHLYLSGEGAMSFAKTQGFQILPTGFLVTEAAKKELLEYKKRLNVSHVFPTIRDFPGTVGAVAIDVYGNVAAATSTGGATGKLPGRIGDSPILGAGTYADNASGCISASGHGETFIRYNAASKILALIQFFDKSAQDAAVEVLDEMKKRFRRPGGVIAIDRKGNMGIYFTTDRMSWAYQKRNELHFGVDKGEDNVEIVEEP